MLSICRSTAAATPHRIETGREGAATIETFVGARIRQRRTDLGISLNELAHLMHMPVDVIDRYEQGKQRTAASHLVQLAGVLRTSLLYFFKEGVAIRRAPQGVEGLKGSLYETRRPPFVAFGEGDIGENGPLVGGN